MKAYYMNAYDVVVGEIWINALACFRRIDANGDPFGNPQLLFTSVLGRKPVVEALWKGMAGGTGHIRVVEADNKKHDIYGRSASQVRPLLVRNVQGYIYEAVFYAHRYMLPWTALNDEQRTSQYLGNPLVFAWGATEEEAKQRFFAVIDKMTSVPLLREWTDEIYDLPDRTLKDVEGLEIAAKFDVLIFGDEKHTSPFRHSICLEFLYQPDEVLLRWLETKYKPIRAEAEAAA